MPTWVLVFFWNKGFVCFGGWEIWRKKKTGSGWLADLNYKNSVNKIMITVVNYRVELGSSSVYLNRTRVCQCELLFPMQTCWFLAVKALFNSILFHYSAVIFFHINLHPAVPAYDFHVFNISLSSFYGIIINQFNDLFPVGLLAQLVESCADIAEVKGLNPVQALIFFSLPFHNCKSCTYKCNDLFSYNSVMIEHLERLWVSFLSSAGSRYWIGKKNSCSSQKSSSSKK